MQPSHTGTATASRTKTTVLCCKRQTDRCLFTPFFTPLQLQKKGTTKPSHHALKPTRVPPPSASSRTLGTSLSLTTWRVNIEAPNEPVDMSSRGSLACYPRRTFLPLHGAMTFPPRTAGSLRPSYAPSENGLPLPSRLRLGWITRGGPGPERRFKREGLFVTPPHFSTRPTLRHAHEPPSRLKVVVRASCGRRGRSRPLPRLQYGRSFVEQSLSRLRDRVRVEKLAFSMRPCEVASP